MIPEVEPTAARDHFLHHMQTVKQLYSKLQANPATGIRAPKAEKRRPARYQRLPLLTNVTANS